MQSAVDNLVITTFSIDPKIGEGRDPNEVATAISTYFGVAIDVGAVRLALEHHLRAGRLLIDHSRQPSCIVLAADMRAQVAERIEASTRLEHDVREEWLAIAERLTPGVDPELAWSALQLYLGQVFNQHGAEAVQLLDSRSDPGRDRGNLSHLLDTAIKDAGLGDRHVEVREAIRAFFIDASANRLRYMSELLDGTFTFFALTVSDSTVDYLKNQVPNLRLFLDTNVVLAVLGMQDNSMQEADLELLEIIEEERYPFKLYYHERTLKEIVTIVEATKTSLRARHFTPALSRAFLLYYESRGGGFGLEKRFHAMNAESPVDVEAFLARFNHIEDLLRERGIERYNQSGSDLDVNAKGAYIAEFEHFLKSRARPGRPPRSYEARDHDITVWMYLQRQRRTTTSALRSGALLLSNDYSLQSFDRSFLMRCDDGRGVPTVVLPHHLLQILRPFSRVTVDFDRRFMEIFAAPEFRTTQTNYGPTVSKVLAYLSSFEGVPTETAVHILNDDLLMGRLRDIEADDEEFGELIESAVISENGALTQEVAKIGKILDSERQARLDSENVAKAAAQAAQNAVAQALADAEVARKTQELEAAERSRAEAKARAEEAEKAELQRKLEEAIQLKDSALEDANRQKSRSKWMKGALVGLVTVLVLVGLFWGPRWAEWRWFEGHDHKVAIQALLGAAVLGTAYVAAGGKHRGTALTAVVIASVITLLSLL